MKRLCLKIKTIVMKGFYSKTVSLYSQWTFHMKALFNNHWLVLDIAAAKVLSLNYQPLKYPISLFTVAS